MKEIKIGRKTYEIKPGDYILDNGACLQFFTGDRRILIRNGFSVFTSLLIPATTAIKIDLSKFRKVIKDGLIYYFFQ